MRGNDLNSLSIDELWKLHEEVAIELARKLQVTKRGGRSVHKQFLLEVTEPASVRPLLAISRVTRLHAAPLFAVQLTNPSHYRAP